MLLYFPDVSEGVSDASRELVARPSYRSDVRVFIYGDFGGGSVTIELYNKIDDVWISVPELVFTEETGQVIELYAGAVIRANVSGCTGVTVEVH